MPRTLIFFCVCSHIYLHVFEHMSGCYFTEISSVLLLLSNAHGRHGCRCWECSKKEWAEIRALTNLSQWEMLERPPSHCMHE